MAVKEEVKFRPDLEIVSGWHYGSGVRPPIHVGFGMKETLERDYRIRGYFVKGGVYILYGENDEILYVGKATNFVARLREHVKQNPYKIQEEIVRVEMMNDENMIELEPYQYAVKKGISPLTLMQSYWIYKLKPKYNLKCNKTHLNEYLSEGSKKVRKYNRKLNNDKYDAMIGKKYSRLTVKSYYRKDYYVYVRCECDCGNLKEIQASNVWKGLTKSCGCILRKELTDKQVTNLVITELQAEWDHYSKHGDISLWDNNFNEFANWALETGFELGNRLVPKDSAEPLSLDNYNWV